MKKHCKICDEIKDVKLFYKAAARVCKDCRNASRRTGKINNGRFKKGIKPWNKGLKRKKDGIS
jgi:hypothetical protein